MAGAHKRYNSIESLQVGDRTITEPKDIKNAAQTFYQNLYKEETEQWRPEFNLQDAPVSPQKIRYGWKGILKKRKSYRLLSHVLLIRPLGMMVSQLSFI